MPLFFDDSHIRQILQAVNITDVISNYVALHPRGREKVGLCPFHDDRRPSMYVSESKQIFKCFACGAGGDVIKFIMLKENMTFPEAVKLLAERAGVKLPERQGKPDKHGDRNKLEEINRWAARFFRQQYEAEEEGRLARDYVARRHINEQTARQFGLGWAPAGWDNLLKAAEQDSQRREDLVKLGLLVEKDQGGYYDRFRQRLMFPVLDTLGRVIAFGGRTLADDPAKYLNSPESVLFNKSNTLYGLHTAKDGIVRNRTAIVVEGYTDCIMAHQFGLTNVVATLGTALTREHARILSRYADTAVLVFDSDLAGKKAAERAVEIFFTQQMVVKIVTLPTGDDPCDFLWKNGENGKAEFERLVSEAVDALEYKWRITQSALNQDDTVSGHKRAVDDYLSLLGRLTNENSLNVIERGYLVNRVAKMIHVDPEKVNSYLNRQRQNQYHQPAQQAQPTTRSLETAGDLRSKALQEILEVILNRPDLFPQAEAVLARSEEMTDPVIRQIAERVSLCYRENATASLAEILAGCQSIELCKRLTDMAETGEQRGNFEATLEGALATLKRLEITDSLQGLKQMMTDAYQKYGKEGEAALLREFQAKHQPGPKGGFALR